MPVSLSIKSDVKALSRQLDDLANKQLPFAAAIAVLGVARRIQEAETKALGEFDRPTPFTMKAFAVTPSKPGAIKRNGSVTIFAKDVQAAYLTPFEVGGPQFLGNKKGMLNPRDIRLNQYGNIPRGTLARLKTKPNIFFGTVVTKNGPVNGVWQRPKPTKAATMRARRRGAPPALDAAKKAGPLKLLVAFGDPVNVKPMLHFADRARAIFDATNWDAELRQALAVAMKTAR